MMTLYDVLASTAMEASRMSLYDHRTAADQSRRHWQPSSARNAIRAARPSS